MEISIKLILNPHLQKFRESNHYIIVVSDVHIGAYNSLSRIGNDNPYNENVIDFIKMLENISEDINYFSALIILGDFFDLITSTYESIINNIDFQKINNYFKDFKNNKIPVILALGNHEIPVNNDYNTDFTNRKNEIIKNFGGLNNIDFCQGVLIKKSSIKFKKRDIRKIGDTSEESVKSYDNCNLLFVHGFQFQNRRLRNFFAKKIWNPLLKEQDLVVKEYINLLWNKYLLENRPMGEIDEILDEYFNQLRITGSSWYINRRRIRSYIKGYKLYKFFIKNKTNERYNNRIVKFLQRFIKTDYYLFYGHTHLCQENLKIGKYLISNPGTWINTTETSCIKINFK